jgi:hypothetical protein
MFEERIANLKADLNGSLRDIHDRLEHGELSPSQALREAKRAKSEFCRNNYKISVMQKLVNMRMID